MRHASEVFPVILNYQLNQIVIKIRVVRNILKLLKISNRFFTGMLYKCLNIGKLSLIASPSCDRLIHPKQTKTTTWRLACLPYTKSLPNSKTNLLHLEKAMNGAAGSYTRYWRSWYRLLHRKRPIYFDVLIRFSETLIFAKSAFTLSWPHPKSLGKGCGKGFGR